MATLEEATRCPKCDEPGAKTETRPADRGGKIYTYECRNERCRWFGDGGWIVQVNPDGTIPERKKGPKEFSPLTNWQESSARAALEQLELEMKRGEVDK